MHIDADMHIDIASDVDMIRIKQHPAAHIIHQQHTASSNVLHTIHQRVDATALAASRNALEQHTSYINNSHISYINNTHQQIIHQKFARIIHQHHTHMSHIYNTASSNTLCNSTHHTSAIHIIHQQHTSYMNGQTDAVLVMYDSC